MAGGGLAVAMYPADDATAIAARHVLREASHLCPACDLLRSRCAVANGECEWINPYSCSASNCTRPGVHMCGLIPLPPLQVCGQRSDRTCGARYPPHGVLRRERLLLSVRRRERALLPQRRRLGPRQYTGRRAEVLQLGRGLLGAGRVHARGILQRASQPRRLSAREIARRPAHSAKRGADRATRRGSPRRRYYSRL